VLKDDPLNESAPGRVIKNEPSPLLTSSPPSVGTGHSTFSAPSYFRIFFQRDLESMDSGRPVITAVRMARGSEGFRGCGTRSEGGFDSFFTAESFSFGLMK
jgi:hypothetical protein